MVKVGRMLLLLFIMDIFVLLSCNETTNTSKDESQSEYSKQLIQEMGLDGQGKMITKEKFKEFIYKLITRNELKRPSDEKFYQSLVNKLSEKVPDEFENKDLEKYINPSTLISIFEEVIKSNYGEDILNEVKKQQVLNKKEGL